MSERPRYDAKALRQRAESIRRSGPEEWLKEALHLEVTGTLDAFAEYVAAAEKRIAELKAALLGVTEHYVNLVNSGDAGFWDREEDRFIKAARKALK